MAIVNFESELHGVGGLKEDTPPNNLDDRSLIVVRAMMIGVSVVEFIENQKSSIYANNLVLEDDKTGRKFSFNLTAKEL